MAATTTQRPWTDEEEAYLREMISDGVSLKAAAGILRRSYSATRMRASRLGLSVFARRRSAWRELIARGATAAEIRAALGLGDWGVTAGRRRTRARYPDLPPGK